MGRTKFNYSIKYFNNSESCENSSCIEKTARSLPRFVIARISTCRMSCISDCITHSVALQFIYAQKCFKDDSTNLKITLSLSLLFVHAKKHNQTQRFQSFLEGIFSTFHKIIQSAPCDKQRLSREILRQYNVEINKKDFSKFRPIIVKEVRNFSKRYNTHLSSHLQVYKNFIDIEVIYLGMDFQLHTGTRSNRHGLRFYKVGYIFPTCLVTVRWLAQGRFNEWDSNSQLAETMCYRQSKVKSY